MGGKAPEVIGEYCRVCDWFWAVSIGALIGSIAVAVVITLFGPDEIGQCIGLPASEITSNLRG
jgi:hypothetical protein